MLRLPGTTDPLLGRPFALYDTVLDAQGQPSFVDVVYFVIGKITERLACLHAGDVLDAWGPLGNGFPELDGLDHIGLVAGGIGQTPFLAYVRELLGQRGYGGRSPRRAARQVSLYYGVRSADLAAGVDDFRAAGAVVHLATDDGSLGHHGYVTDLLGAQSKPGASATGTTRPVADAPGSDVAPQHLIGCGPEPMLRALAKYAAETGTPCHLSLETPMACGVGICFSCVTRVRTADGWDYRRVCLDGPVFNAADLVWG